MRARAAIAAATGIMAGAWMCAGAPGDAVNEAGPAGEGWTVVSGELPAYRNHGAAEVILAGRMVLENYGRPGEMYIRPPINYYLQTKERKIMLGPAADGPFRTLDGKAVEARGKLKDNPPGTKEKQFLWVGWIRERRPV